MMGKRSAQDKLFAAIRSDGCVRTAKWSDHGRVVDHVRRGHRDPVPCWWTSPGDGADGDGTGHPGALITTGRHGRDGDAHIVRRTHGIVRGRSSGLTVRDTVVTGTIVHPTTGHRRRGIGLDTQGRRTIRAIARDTAQEGIDPCLRLEAHGQTQPRLGQPRLGQIRRGQIRRRPGRIRTRQGRAGLRANRRAIARRRSLARSQVLRVEEIGRRSRRGQRLRRNLGPGPPRSRRRNPQLSPRPCRSS